MYTKLFIAVYVCITFFILLFELQNILRSPYIFFFLYKLFPHFN